ncbi:hypothetical protein TNCT_382011 [Trichonephila clavata]|uniref:Uncharacterized protein n=1 Tax=Trichonephila clavata TaxID=2740835 RepID=A0A8X6KAW1_TRICU|nr:hypothetical protein TNCT_382011 [Trichonephila clavata]
MKVFDGCKRSPPRPRNESETARCVPYFARGVTAHFEQTGGGVGAKAITRCREKGKLVRLLYIRLFRTPKGTVFAQVTDKTAGGSFKDSAWAVQALFSLGRTGY